MSENFITKALREGGGGYKLELGPGVFSIDDPILTSAPNQSIVGCGSSTVLLQESVDRNKNGIVNTHSGFSVKNLKILSSTQIGNENAAILNAGPNPIFDILIENCDIVGFSYAVVIKNAIRPNIIKNRIYSTGSGKDTGGAIQLSSVSGAQIHYNLLDGNPFNRFQHGMYIAGDVENCWFTNNIIQNGFYSFAFHFYGSTFVNGRNNIWVERNLIRNVPNGIVFSRPLGKTGITENVFVNNNIIEVEDRGIILSGKLLENINFTYNICSSSKASNPIFEVGQSAGDVLKNLVISFNTFSNFKNGGLDLNNATMMERVRIINNVFSPRTENDVPIFLSNSSSYNQVSILNNISDKPISIGSWKNSKWLNMKGNSWNE